MHQKERRLQQMSGFNLTEKQFEILCNSTQEAKELLNDWFPKTEKRFDKNGWELIEGEWYICDNYLIIYKGNKLSPGFIWGSWGVNWHFYNLARHCVKATESEIQEALINYAKSLGYHSIAESRNFQCVSTLFLEGYFYSHINDVLWYSDGAFRYIIYRKGEWSIDSQS